MVEGIEVLNVNELAKSLRMAYLPGEHGLIELTQKGNDQHQAVGHLEDGTMVVVEHAYKQIGSTVEVEFIRSLQTAAGKMMFAKLAQPQSAPQKKARGTAPVAIKKPRAALKPTKPVQRSSRSSTTATPQKTPQRKQSRRPRSPEESLMELLDKQD